MTSIQDPRNPLPKGKERRRYPRAPADWPLTLNLDDGEHVARIRDVSRSGVCFFLDRAIKMMTLLEVKLDLPVPEGVRHITGRGAVVRCEKIGKLVDHFEVAVFLHDLAEPDREALDTFVAETAGVRSS